MTVVNTSAFAGPFYANGVTTEFPFDFDVGASSDVVVYVNGNVLSPGAYIVEIEDGGSGTVVISPPIPAGEIVLELSPSFQQLGDFQRHGPLFPDAINPHLDIAARRDIWLREQARRSVKAAPGRDGITLSATDSGVLIAIDGNISVGNLDGIEVRDEGIWSPDSDLVDNEGLWA